MDSLFWENYNNLIKKKIAAGTISPDQLAEYEDSKKIPGLKAARDRRQFEALRSLQCKKSSKLRQILLEAVKTGNRDAVSNAIGHGAEVILYLMVPCEYDYASTLLGLAAHSGHHNLITCLLRAGIDIDDRGGSNRTPLQNAVERNDVTFARKLIEAGADLETTTLESAVFTSLHLAVNYGHTEIIKLLLQEKANIDALSCYEYTPLHRAAMHNQLSVIEILLEAGCNRDARIHLGGTALHVAAMYDKKEAAELLIKKGFDLELKDNNGHTPMESAEVRGHESLAHWLAKLRLSKLDDCNIYSLSSSGPLPSVEQTEKSVYSAQFYNADNVTLFEMVDSCSEYSMKWKQLRVNIPRICSGYYQDHIGLTVLHVASKNGHFKAVKLLIEKLDIYPNLTTYSGDLPSDLAESEGHISIARYLKTANKQKPLSFNSQNELYEKLLTVISSGDNIQEASRLLKQGAPLESYGRSSPSALAMAIQWNRVMIIELLLAAGAPLTVKHHGKTLLQVAWFSPDVTIRVRIIITRAYIFRLHWERMTCLGGRELEDIHLVKEQTLLNIIKIMDVLDTPAKVYLNAGMVDLLNTLQGKTPWKARWKIIEEAVPYLRLLSLFQFPNNPFGFSLKMGTAAKYNCNISAFFLRQAGGHPNHRTGHDLTPLHDALDAKFYDLAKVMVKHLGASLYIPDINRRFPTDLMPTKMKQELEQEQVVEEFNKLEKSIYSARSEAEKAEIKEIALVLVCLYATFTRKWDHHLCNWQDLYCYLVSILQVKSKRDKNLFKSEANIVSKNEDFIWVSIICQELNQFNKGNHNPNEDTSLGFLELLACIEYLNKNIKINESKLNIIQSVKFCKSAYISTSNVLLKSVKLATENNFRTFLHLLLTIGEQKLDIPLNNLIRSLPLHHAAAAGNFSAILYLTLTVGAHVNVLDINNNTPAHLAYMNGYSYIGDYLCKHDQNVELIENNAGQKPKIIHKAFQKYEKMYDIVKDKDATDESVNLNEQIDGLSLTTKLLDYWLSKTKSISFRKIMKNAIVDYSFGEAKLVQSLVVDFAKSIGSKIAEYNPLLKGTLFLVGSAGDKVRLNAPDESDCTWLLDWKNVRVNLEDMSKEDQEMKHYKHIIKAESDDIEIQRLLEGTNLLEEFYKQSVKAISELLPNLDPRISLILPGVKRIGCGVCITLAWAGTRYPMLMVDMDLVPAFRASRPSNFIHPPLTKNIEDPRLDAIIVVQTYIKRGEMRCSTTLEEQVVMQQLSTEQRLVFTTAKLLVSKLKTEKWASKLFQERFTFFSTKQFKLPAPTGFLLKSAFFQELENVPDPEDWEENCIVDRLKDIFYSMCKKDDKDRLHSGLVPSYFSSTIQPPAAGFMAPAIYKFLVDNEEELRKMGDSTFDTNEDEELEQLAHMWNEVLNKYYYIH